MAEKPRGKAFPEQTRVDRNRDSLQALNTHATLRLDHRAAGLDSFPPSIIACGRPAALSLHSLPRQKLRL